MNPTPMMKQYLEIKSRAKEALLFFRLGDFYELFFDDAKTASKALGLTLTGRDGGFSERVPMCGVPHHASSTYIKRLIDQGFSIALAEQLTLPQKGKTMVERDIVKIITPGTVDELDFLDATKNNYVASVYYHEKQGSIAWCDVTTGEFFAIETSDYENTLAMINPREIISNKDNCHYRYAFASTTALDTIKATFKIMDTKVFDIGKTSPIVNSAGALLEFILQTQKEVRGNILKISVVREGEYMMLDSCARENLELVHQYKDSRNKYGSLLWLLDETKTPMGARKLTDVILKPLQCIDAINARLDAVDELLKSNDTSIVKSLDSIWDVSRLAGRIGGGIILPREINALGESLNQLESLKASLSKFDSELITETNALIMPLRNLSDYIHRAIKSDPPAKLEDGGFIKEGFDAKLDELVVASTQGMAWLSDLESRERTETGLKELKIGYNRVSGYYFEIPIRLSDKVPYRFTRRATTINTERYITEELKTLEEKITGVQEKIKAQESKLLQEIRTELKKHIPQIVQNAEAVATIDILQSFAVVSRKYNLTRPVMSKSGSMTLKSARHPVLERIIGSNKFISNDFDMTRGSNSTMLITGPNMAGKSTYMRTVAINVLLAHLGCFVACEKATIPITDRIFTRIGASDSQLTGQSTFMMEMNEVSNIIHNATAKSLLLLDEIGRGTGTRDGFALASAIITYITEKVGAITMFATHFHELTDLEKENPNIQNFKVLVSEINGEIVFLHKVQKGAEQKSFGIDVAKLSGIPDVVIKKAKALMKIQPKAQQVAQTQMAMETKSESTVEQKIREIDINQLTPMEALAMLGDLVKEAQNN